MVTAITAVVSSLGAPLVPTIAHEYNVRLSAAQWTLTATLLAGTIATPIVGRLASGPLRRPGIIAGLVITTAGCLIAAIPGYGLGPLLVGRTLQGAGLPLVPLAMAVARDALPTNHIQRSVAWLSVAVVGGAGLGYPITGFIAHVSGLTAAFLIGAAATGITGVLAWRYVPTAPAAQPDRVEWGSAALLASSMLAILLAISQGDAWGWTSTYTLTLAVSGVIAMGAWGTMALRSSHPLADLRLAVRPGIAVPNLVAVVAGLGMYSLLTLAIVVVRADDSGFGLSRSVLAAGVVLTPYSAMSVLGNQLAQWVSQRLGSRVLLPTGSMIFAVATALLGSYHDTLWQVLAIMALAGTGSGFTFSAIPSLMMPHLPQRETSSALAVNQLLRYLGITTGSAAGVALFIAYGSGDVGYVRALYTFAALWVVIGGAAAWLDRRADTTNTSSFVKHSDN